MAVRLLLLGAPGSGKGTQGPPLAQRYGVPHVSSGELLRHQVEVGNGPGREWSAALDRGELVPDDVILSVMEGVLTSPEAAGGYVLDGFPRTATQAERAEDLLARTGGLDAVVYLDLPDGVVRERLAERATAQGRSDDDREVVERRLRFHHDQVGPLLDHYRRQGTLVTVDATGSPDEVAREIASRLAARGAGGGRGNG